MTKRLTAQTVELKQTTAGDGVKLVNNSLAWTERHLTHTLSGARQSLYAPVIFSCSLVNLSPWYPPCSLPLRSVTSSSCCLISAVGKSMWRALPSPTGGTERSHTDKLKQTRLLLFFCKIIGVYYRHLLVLVGVCFGPNDHVLFCQCLLRTVWTWQLFFIKF